MPFFFFFFNESIQKNWGQKFYGTTRPSAIGTSDLIRCADLHLELFLFVHGVAPTDQKKYNKTFDPYAQTKLTQLSISFLS